jgi:hypothetical protein
MELRQIQMSLRKMIDDESDEEFDDLEDETDYNYIEDEDDSMEDAVSDKIEEFKDRLKSQDNARSDLVRAALETHLLEYASKRTEQKRNLEELTCIVEEFMDSFIVLGYNYDGEPLTLVSASTQQQADSLSTLLQKFIVTSGQGKNNGGLV